MMALVFQTTDFVYDSWVRKTAFGFYEEVKDRIYTAEDRLDQKLKLGKYVWDFGQNFDAGEDLEMVSFTWRKRLADSYSVMNSESNNLYQLIFAVIVYMWFHTGSLFIASLSLINIFMSVPIALVIYRHVLNI